MIDPAGSCRHTVRLELIVPFATSRLQGQDSRSHTAFRLRLNLDEEVHWI